MLAASLGNFRYQALRGRRDLLSARPGLERAEAVTAPCVYDRRGHCGSLGAPSLPGLDPYREAAPM